MWLALLFLAANLMAAFEKKNKFRNWNMFFALMILGYIIYTLS